MVGAEWGSKAQSHVCPVTYIVGSSVPNCFVI